MPSSSFFSTVNAFAFAFLYYSLCEFLFSSTNTLLVPLFFMTTLPLLTTCTFLQNGLVESFVEYYLSVLPDISFNFLLEDLVEVFMDHIITPA